MRRKSAETRQQIIDAAYTLFYQSGFMRAGVDAIANAAGITKRTLYHAFNLASQSRNMIAVNSGPLSDRKKPVPFDT